MLAYAISLPLSMTLSWVLLIIGLTLVAAHLFLNREDALLLAGAPLMVPVAVFCAAAAISGLHHGGLLESLYSIWSLKALACYFFAAFCIATQPRLANVCICGLLSVSAAAGIFGAVEQIFDFHPFGYHYLQGTGFLSGPMAYAGQMQLFAMLSLALALTGGYRWLSSPWSGKRVFLFVTIANCLGLLFCGERSAWLGAMSAVIVSTYLLSRRIFWQALLTLSAVAAIGWFCVPLVHSRLQSTFNPGSDVSTQARVTVWRRAIVEWQHSPIVGIGLLNFPHLPITEATVPGRSKDLHHAHSNYLQMLSTAGIIGLAAFLFLIFAAMRAAIGLWRQSKKASNLLAQGIGLGLFSGLVSLAVSGLFEYNFGTAQVRLSQWFLLGMLALAGTVSGSAGRPRQNSDESGGF